MKKKKMRKMLGILLCIALLFTQAMPLSFVYAEENGEIGMIGSETDGSGLPDEDLSGDASGNGAINSDSSDENEDSDAAESDGLPTGGETEDDMSFDDTQDGEADQDEDAAQPAGYSEDNFGISLLEEEEETEPAVDTSWYSADSESKTASLSTAAQLRGLAALVNGTATDSEGTAIAAETFAGWTITLTDDIDLSGDASGSSDTTDPGEGTDSADTTDTAASEWTPIGSSASNVFSGSFDGAGHKITGMSITTAGTYLGFFGNLKNAQVENLNLTGSIKVTTPSSTIDYVGGLAGYINTAALSDISVDVDMDCTLTKNDCTGGIAGYAVSLDAENCSGKGQITFTTTGTAVKVAGLIGDLEQSQITDSSSDVSISAKSGGSEAYLGGIAAYVCNRTVIDRCINRGDIDASAGVASYKAYIGGIAGYLLYNWSAGTECRVMNSVNEGDIEAATSSYLYLGGLVGNSYGGIVHNAANTGNLSILRCSSSNGYVGGLLGYGYSSELRNGCSFGTISSEVTLNKGGYIVGYMSGTVSNCCASSDSGLPVANYLKTGEAIGLVDSDGTVTASESYPLPEGSSTDLETFINGWVYDNITADTAYNIWKSDTAGVWTPTGVSVLGAPAPSIDLSASSLLAAVGSSVTLKAEIKAEAHSMGSSKLSYQWYVSDYSGKSNPTPLEGENASGQVDGLSATTEYVVSAADFSDKYYFLVVTNSVTLKDEEGTELGTTETEVSSDELNIVFLDSEYVDGYNGETADSFAGGTGTAEDPYLIATPAQLKLMAEKISDKTGVSAYYKLTADIDFNYMRWTPAGTTSVAAANAFSGCLDGDGHTIKNIRIVSNNRYVGLFAYVSTGTVKNITVEGSLQANGVGTQCVGGIAGSISSGCTLSDIICDMDISAVNCQYVGGIFGYCSNSSSVTMANTVHRGAVSTVDCQYVGGLAGYNQTPIANCANIGDVVYKTTDSYTKAASSYVGGLVGYHYRMTMSNCIFDGSLTGDLSEVKAGLVVGYSYILASLNNCYVSASDSQEAPAMVGEGASYAKMLGVTGSDGNVTAAEGYELPYEGVTKLSSLLNMWVIENVDAAGTCRYWVKDGEGGIPLPMGRTVALPAAPEISLTASAENAEANTDVTIMAEVNGTADAEESTSLSWQWYTSDYESGSMRTALEDENASGTLEDMTGTITYTVNKSEYSDQYYFLVVTSTVTYKDGEEILGTTSSSAEDKVHITIKDSNASVYQGETAEQLTGEGTAEAPYQISTPAELSLFNTWITNGKNADSYYVLTADIDYNNVKWMTAGSSVQQFKGSFDGGGHKISNLKILSDGDYSGLFAYLNGATVQNLTLEGSENVSGTKYVGSVAGYASDATIKNVTSRVAITAENAQYAGGLVGYITASVGGALRAFIDNSSNCGDITVRGLNGYSTMSYYGGLAGYAKWSKTSNSYNLGDVKFEGEDLTASITVYAAGLIGYNYESSLWNLANHGNLSVNKPNAAGVSYMNGITYNYISSGMGSSRPATSIFNCISRGEKTNNSPSATTRTGIYFNGSTSLTVGSCYVEGTSETTLADAFTVASGLSITGIGYFDEKGNLTAFSGYTVGYPRTDEQRELMGSDITDILCTVSNYAADQNAESSAWNSWTLTDGLPIPAGEPEKSPFDAIGVAINDLEYEDKRASGEIFKADDELPAMVTEVSGAPEGSTILYQWYMSKRGAYSTVNQLIENDSEDPSIYNPSTSTTGKTWYWVTVTVVNGNYYKTLSSNAIMVEVESSGDVWEGLVASADDIEGYGTEAYPYLIKDGEQLAFIVGQITNAGTKTLREDGPEAAEDPDKSYRTYNTAYYEITKDIVLDGAHTMGDISGFSGHFSGRQQEDGTYPTISNKIEVLFSSVTNAVVENFNIENGTGNTSLIASSATNSTFRNITVSGTVKGSSYVGAIVGTSNGVTIDHCINRASVSGSTVVSGGMGVSGTAGIGGLIGYISSGTSYNDTVIINSGNEGDVTGANAGGLVGYHSGSAIPTNMTHVEITGCYNTGTISGGLTAGGLLGYSASSTFKDNYNTGSIKLLGTGNYRDTHYAGGLMGSGSSPTFTNCFNTGSVSYVGESQYITYTLRAICGQGSSVRSSNNYFLTADPDTATSNSYETALTADQMKTAVFSLDLGDAYLVTPEDSYPVLAWQTEAKTVSATANEDGAALILQIGSHEVTEVNAVEGSKIDFTPLCSQGYRVTGVSQTVGGGEATAMTANADGTYTLSISEDTVLIAETEANAYTVQLKDHAQTSDSNADGITYQAGDEVSIDVIVKSTKTGETVDFAALQAGVTFDPELLEYLGSSADSESADETATESTVVSAGETAGSLLITRTSGSNTTVNNDGTVVVTLNFRVLNHISVDEVETVADVSAAAGSQGSDPDLSDISQLVVPVSAVITLAPSQVVFITDYAAAPSGYKLAAYRTALALEEGTALFYGKDAMIHASAFDSLELVPVTGDGDTNADGSGNVSGDESGSAAEAASSENVTVGDASDETIYTYVYFVASDMTAAEAAGNMKFGEGSCAEVDYEDYDITENAIVNIFDAQRVWDLFSFENFVDAVDFVSGPGMYQRLHADVDQNGTVDVIDALRIQRFLHFGEETDDSGETASEETPAA